MIMCEEVVILCVNVVIMGNYVCRGHTEHATVALVQVVWRTTMKSGQSRHERSRISS